MELTYKDTQGNDHTINLVELDEKGFSVMLLERFCADDSRMTISYELSIFDNYYQVLERRTLIDKEEFDRIAEQIDLMKKEKEVAPEHKNISFDTSLLVKPVDEDEKSNKDISFTAPTTDDDEETTASQNNEDTKPSRTAGEKSKTTGEITKRKSKKITKDKKGSK